MKRLAFAVTGLTVLSVVSVLLSAGCDDQDKKKADLLAKTGGSAAGSASAAAVSPAIASANALGGAVSANAVGTGAAPATKAPKECGADVTIDDPDLEAEIRNKLKKPKDANPGPLTGKDLAGLTSLKYPAKASAPLTELDPCLFPKLVGLKFLYLPRGSYKDLSPISNSTKLEGLFAGDSEVEDLKPLEKMVALDQLGLSHTKVADLSTVANLVNLTELMLDDTKVVDLGPLAKCTKLMSLSIKNTAVTDVSALKGLTKLTKLNVAGTALTNLDALDSLKAHGLKILTK